MSIRQVTNENNFCKVFELPDAYPSGFCFGGGHPVNFQMVDWFQPIPCEDMNGERSIKTWPQYTEMLEEWLVQKTYVKPGRTYLLITDFGECMMFGRS